MEIYIASFIALLFLIYIRATCGSFMVCPFQWRSIGSVLAYMLPILFFAWWILFVGQLDQAHRFRIALLGSAFDLNSQSVLELGGDKEKHVLYLEGVESTQAIAKVFVVNKKVYLENTEKSNNYFLATQSWMPNTLQLQHGDEIVYKGKTWSYYNKRSDPENFLPYLFHGQFGFKFKIGIIDSENNFMRFEANSSVYSYSLEKYIIPLELDGELVGFFHFDFFNAINFTFFQKDIQIIRNGHNKIEGLATQAKEIQNNDQVYLYKLSEDKKHFDKKYVFTIVKQKNHLVFKNKKIESYSFTHNDLRELYEKKYVDDNNYVNLLVKNFGFQNLPDTAVLKLPNNWLQLYYFKTFQQPAYIVSSQGAYSINNGELFFLGDEDIKVFQVDVMTPPVNLIFLMLLLLLIKVLLANLARFSAAHLFVAMVIEFFLIFRIILAYRAWVLPPNDQEAMEVALIAWVFLPWAFIMAAYAFRKQEQVYPQSKFLFSLGLFFAVFSMVWAWVLTESIYLSLFWILLHVLVLSLPWLKPKLYQWVDNYNHLNIPIKVIILFVLSIIFFVIRPIIGKEATYIAGFRFPLSLLHIPFVLIIISAYFALVYDFIKKSDLSISQFIGLSLLFVLLVALLFIPTLFARDYGFILIFLPVILLAAFIFMFKLLPYKKVILAVVIALSIVILFVPKQPLLDFAFQNDRFSHKEYFRLLQITDIEALKQAATRRSEELATTLATIHYYTDTANTNPWNNYYASTEMSPDLENMFEHSIISFVHAEWGKYAVAGLFLLYIYLFLLAINLFYNFDKTNKNSTALIGYFTGMLALLTFAFTSIYMFLGLYNLVLFTGKNVYLFALGSKSDIWEALLLLTLFSATVLRYNEKST